MLSTDPLHSFNQYNTVTTNDHHAYVELLIAGSLLDSIVQYDIHVRIEASQNSRHCSPCVQL